jgi:hypothetical protein
MLIVRGDSGAETAIPESSTRSCFCSFDSLQSLTTRRLLLPARRRLGRPAGRLRRPRKPLRRRHRQLRTAAVASFAANTIIVEVDEIAPAQPATAAHGLLPK